MQKNQRKNRPKKKEIPIEKWDQDISDLKRRYEYGGKKKDPVQEN